MTGKAKSKRCFFFFNLLLKWNELWYYREGETRNVAGSEGVSPREVYKRVWCGGV
jgi:hypothetical protein